MSQSPMHVEVKRLTEEAVKALRSKMAPTNKVTGEGEFEVVATTDSVDRDGEILLAEGWDFKNYLNNPIVLWCHDWYSMPIGAVTGIEQVDGKTIMKGVFANTELGQEVRSLYESGILRTVSVGCIIKERKGPVLTKMEMIELSFVSVPANPEAMSTEQSKSLEKIKRMVKTADEAVTIRVEEEKEEEGEEKPKEVIQNPEPVPTDTTTVDLPKSTDNVEAPAKGLGLKAGRVLSAKNITAIQETLTQMATHKTGLEKTMEMLQAVLDSADSDKDYQDELRRKAVEDDITADLRLTSKIVSEINRKRKLLTT